MCGVSALAKPKIALSYSSTTHAEEGDGGARCRCAATASSAPHTVDARLKPGGAQRARMGSASVSSMPAFLNFLSWAQDPSIVVANRQRGSD